MQTRFSFALPVRRPQHASTLLVSMLVILVITAFLAVAASVTNQYGRNASRQQGVGMESAYADAASEYAFAQWKSYMQGASKSGAAIPKASVIDTAVTASLPTFKTAVFPYASQLGIDDTTLTVRIYAVDQNGQNNLTADISSPTTTLSTDAPTRVQTQNVPGYPGWTGYTYNYMALVKFKSVHFGMTSSGGAASPGEYYQARRYFQLTKVPLCQAVVFYENNLEIHPGADMYLNGPVHTNQHLWAQAIGVGVKLQFLKNVSYVSGIDDDSSNPDAKYSWADGKTLVTNPNQRPDVYAPYSPTLYADGGASSAYPAFNYGKTYPAISQSKTEASQVNQVTNPIDPFGGASTSNNGLRDIIEKPDPTNTSDQIAYNNAALVVEVDSSVPLADTKGNLSLNPTAVSIQVRDPSTGKLVTVTGLATDPNKVDYNAVYNAINKGALSTFTDKRESATVYVTNLDMAQLDTITTAPGGTGTGTLLQKAFNTNGTQGGTVYIHDTSKIRTGGTRAAIRLINGRDLGENVSVASDNGVYIQGDYNTGTGTIPSNAAGVTINTTPTPDPQSAGYSRYAASVMADAVTVLSNSWKDGSSQDDIGSSTRKATATTVNAAILSGDVVTNGDGQGYPSGGVHNFPRFLENWTGVNFTYYGSLIEAYKSESFTGHWQTGSVYTWPNRLWNFDANFLNQQPPGMPQGVQYSRGRWERSYIDLKS